MSQDEDASTTRSLPSAACTVGTDKRARGTGMELNNSMRMGEEGRTKPWNSVRLHIHCVAVDKRLHPKVLTKLDGNGALAKEGRMEALDVHAWKQGGNTMDLSFPIVDRCLFHVDNAYRIPNMRAVGTICKTNLPSNTAFRGFGAPMAMLMTETLVEQVADRTGLARHQVSEANFYKTGDKTHFGQEVDRCTIERLWSQLKTKSEFETRLAAVAAFNAENKLRKRGIAMIPTKFGCSFTAPFLNQGGALVHVYADGSVMITHGGTEMGQGLHTKMSQIAAHAFGVSMDVVSVSPTGTDKVPNTSATAASLSSDINGMAILNACNTINDRLKPLREKYPEKTFAELAHEAYFARINLSANGFFKVNVSGYDFDTKQGTPFAYFSYGASCSEVEVDVLTGDFNILRTDIVMDVGNSLNPTIDIGQIEGAFVQGMGWCTMEELVRGDEQHTWVRPGQLLTRGPGAYKIPSFNDVPLDFRVSLLEDAANPVAIHRSKAIGEPPFFLATSVYFAIRQAVQAARADNGHAGYFAMDSPASCERIRMGCADKLQAIFEADAKYKAKGSW